jgi:hypothetical protein
MTLLLGSRLHGRQMTEGACVVDPTTMTAEALPRCQISHATPANSSPVVVETVRNRAELSVKYDRAGRPFGRRWAAMIGTV